MPLTLQVKGFFFGLFGAILASVWLRAGTVALGGDAYGLDIVASCLLLCFCTGATLGAHWSQSVRTKWWPFFAIFGIGAGLFSLGLPYLGSFFQNLYHSFEGGFGAASITMLAFLAFAVLPWGCGGVAFARMTAGADGQVLMPLAFGGALGIFLLDRLAGPSIGGLFPLLIASLGMFALAVGHEMATPLLHRREKSVLRPILFAGFTGALLGIAGKAGILLLLQFFPGSRQEIAWIQVLLLVGIALGSLGFGGPASLAKNPLLWTWLYIGILGISLGISLAIAGFLQEPSNYLYYFGSFHAGEGSLLQGFLLFVALGGLPSLALGASLRCLANPAAEPSRPSVAACVSAMGFGLAVGILLTGASIIPYAGIAGSVKITLVLLVGLGALGILLATGSGGPGKVVAVGACALGVALLIPFLPQQIEVRNAYAPGTIAVRERVESRDGIAQATIEPGRLTELWWNRNSLRANEEQIEKLEIALAVLAAQGPDRALSLSAVTPSRWEWLRAAGISQVDLCPSAPLLGEISIDRDRPEAVNAALYRAPAGIPKQYPLLLAFPEPLWPANVSSRWTGQGLVALREKLTENGCLVLWLRPRECSAEALREIAHSFAEVFPSVEALLAFSGLHGPSLALVGRLQAPPPISTESRVYASLRQIRSQPAFSSLPLRSAEDLEGFRIAGRDRILEATAGASGSWGPIPPISWNLRPRFRPEQQTEGLDFLLALSTRATRGEELDRVTSLRLVLMGFLEKLRRQPVIEGWIPPFDSGEIGAAELQRFLEALQVDPKFTPVLRLWEAVGERGLAQGDAALLAGFLEKAAALAPSDGPIQFLLGRAYQEARSERAVEALRKAATMQSDRADRWHYLGIALHGSNDLAEATKSLERSREIDPRNASNLAALALCYRDLGDFARARETLEAARAIAPEDPKVREAVEKLR